MGPNFVARDKRAMDFRADSSRLSERCVEGFPFLRCYPVDDQLGGGRKRARVNIASSGDQTCSLGSRSRSKVGTLKTYDQRYPGAARSLTSLPRCNHALGERHKS